MNKESLLRADLDALYSEMDLGALLEKIVGKVRLYTECKEASIFIYNSLKEELYFETVSGDNLDELKAVTIPKGEGVVGWVAKKQEPVIINDCAKDTRFTTRVDRHTNFETQSVLAAPILRHGKLVGVLEAINKHSGRFSQEDVEVLKQIARYVSIPMQNALLFKKVSRGNLENQRLLEMAKTISYSGSLEEVLEQLKTIICAIISPREINVMVQSSQQTKMYQLLDRSDGSPVEEKVIDTIVDDKVAVFPLKSKNRRLGFLELKVDKRIPQHVMSLFRGLAAFVAILIEKMEMQTLMIEKERVQKELQIARSIQQSFLLNEPMQINKLETAFKNIPSSEVGGDYYDIIKRDDNCTIFTINDIAGHGIPASLLMSTFRTHFVYQITKNKSIYETIASVNDLLARTTDAKHFVTSFTCLLDTGAMRLSYINAGHNPPFIIRGDETIKLDRRSIAVGWFPDVQFKEVEEPLFPGDLMVLYTDGIIEAETPSGQDFGLKRFIDLVRLHGHQSAQQLKETVIQQLQAFVGCPSYVDDITFIIIKLDSK